MWIGRTSKWHLKEIKLNGETHGLKREKENEGNEGKHEMDRMNEPSHPGSNFLQNFYYDFAAFAAGRAFILRDCRNASANVVCIPGLGHLELMTGSREMCILHVTFILRKARRICWRRSVYDMNKIVTWSRDKSKKKCRCRGDGCVHTIGIKFLGGICNMQLVIRISMENFLIRDVWRHSSNTFVLRWCRSMSMSR